MQLDIFSFIYSPTDVLVSCLKKNNIKIYIKTAPKCFGAFYNTIRERINLCLLKLRLLK